MFNKKLSLTANMIILPFITFYKYEKNKNNTYDNLIEKLAKKTSIEKYNRTLSKEYEKIYKVLANTSSISNFDEINLLFNKFYPKEELNNYKDNIAKFYMKVLTNLQKSFISHRDGKIVFKYWKSEGEEDFIGPYSGINKIAFWNYLNRIFTTDLLVVKYLLDNGVEDPIDLEGFSSTITLADSQLEGVLSRGVAETHIHKNAAINFYIGWQDLMNLTGKSSKNYKKNIFQNQVFYSEIDLKPHLLAIAIVRVVMACFLERRDDGNWYNYVHNYLENKKVRNLCDAIEDGQTIEMDSYNFFKLWEEIIDELGIFKVNDEKKNSYKEDILKNIFTGYGESNIILENILLFKAMQYIMNNNDVNFGKVFINYIRIKNKVLQTKVQSNRIKGLENFKNYFKRSTNKTSIYEEKNYWKILIENQFQNPYLEKLELRAAIGIGSIEKIKIYIKDIMISFLTAYKEILQEKENLYGRDVQYPDLGIVFHLKKDIDVYKYEKCWANFEDDDYKELYFIEHRNVYSKQVEALNQVRENIPGLSDYIVGLDAASSENDTEPWVFAPIYRSARDSKRKDIFYKKGSLRKRIKTLKFTYHVGEDFRHLISGLRHIDEVIENFKFHAGDRIGHGIALGVDVDRWIRGNRIVVLPRIEHMENMLWVWGLYKDGYYNNSFDVSYLEQEIMIQAEKIYGVITGINIYTLWKVYKGKFNDFVPNEGLIELNKLVYNSNTDSHDNRLFCKYGKGDRSIIWDEETLSHAMHCRCYLEKMLEPIQVEVSYDKADLMKQLQKIVCNKISTGAIVVETNPTSNLAIGEIESIFEHYIHNLNNRGLSNEGDKENSMMVTINSDDPSVFNTNVSNELSYIFYALQEKGYDRENILEWIDKIRQYGMDSSFIEKSNKTITEKIEELENLISELKA